MSATSPFFAAIAVLLALLVAIVLMKVESLKLPIAQESETYHRYSTIDGLRGYLGFFVFIHHSCIWYFYLQTGRWELPPSNLYIQFGQSSVALFFMVTSFLFVTKIIDARATSIDWLKLYVSRVMRLVPLYLVAISFLLLIIAQLSAGEARVEIGNLLMAVFDWLTFTVNGIPDINGVKNTYIVIAGVTWSLPYEWFFYLLLPILALLLTRRIYWVALFVSFIFVCFYLEAWRPVTNILNCFIGGVVAAGVCRYPRLHVFLRSKALSVVAIISLLSVLSFQTAYSTVPLLALSMFFSIVAAGNSLFGILALKVSRWLGDLSYGIYLFHGLILFSLFNYVIGFEVARKLDSAEFWICVFSVIPFILILARIGNRCIERPAMRSVNSVMMLKSLAVRKFKLNGTCTDE